MVINSKRDDFHRLCFLQTRNAHDRTVFEFNYIRWTLGMLHQSPFPVFPTVRRQQSEIKPLLTRSTRTETGFNGFRLKRSLGNSRGWLLYVSVTMGVTLTTLPLVETTTETAGGGKQTSGSRKNYARLLQNRFLPHPRNNSSVTPFVFSLPSRNSASDICVRPSDSPIFRGRAVNRGRLPHAYGRPW